MAEALSNGFGERQVGRHTFGVVGMAPEHLPALSLSSVGEFDPRVRDLLAAFDGVQESSSEAAAVGDRRGIGVEQADEDIDVSCLPCLFEVLDDLGLPRRSWRVAVAISLRLLVSQQPSRR